MRDFEQSFKPYFSELFRVVAIENGEWTVKGFIDVHENIYTINVDTKVISKIIELMIFPIILRFANENGYDMILSSHQNHYPDISFIDKESGNKIALDLKSTYRTDPLHVNGMTLGAFTGYFRNRTSNKNITFPYNQYQKHYVLGVIYNKTELHQIEQILLANGYKLNNSLRNKLTAYFANGDDNLLEECIGALHKLNKNQNEIPNIKQMLARVIIDERRVHSIKDLTSILSVVRDFDFFLQEKWKIAIDRPGSGNTKNIGSTTLIKELKEGSALFTRYKDGKQIFDDYWTYYLTKDMARAVDLDAPPYTNIASYINYKERLNTDAFTQNN